MEPTKETTEQVSPAEITLGGEAELTGLHVLIVEDVGMIAMELRMMLENLGCHIVGVVSRLDEAMKLAQVSERLDGVLLDLNLSGESAYPVAEILNERGIPFIIMSGYDTSHIRSECECDAYLQKPINHDELARLMLRTFLPGKTVGTDSD